MTSDEPTLLVCRRLAQVKERRESVPATFTLTLCDICEQIVLISLGGSGKRQERLEPADRVFVLCDQCGFEAVKIVNNPSMEASSKGDGQARTNENAKKNMAAFLASMAERRATIGRRPL